MRRLVMLSVLLVLLTSPLSLPGTASADEADGYLNWEVNTGRYCKNNTPATKPGKTIDPYRDVRKNKKGWTKWRWYKTTQSATGHLVTHYQYQDRVSRAHVMKRCTNNKVVRYFSPRAYQHRTRSTNLNCYGMSCQHIGTKTNKWRAGVF